MTRMNQWSLAICMSIFLPISSYSLNSQSAKLIRTLAKSDHHTHREKIEDPEGFCDKTEVIQHRVIHRCGKFFFYSSKQEKGCWGASGAGAWDASTASIHFSNGENSVHIGFGDRPPVFLKETQGKTCPDVLISSEGGRFGRIYHKTGYGKFSFDPKSKSYEPEQDGENYVEYNRLGKRVSKK